VARNRISYKPRKSKALLKALGDAKTRTLLTRNMFKATRLNGFAAEAIMRDVLQSSGGLEKNAALTQAIKGGDKPLVDSSALFGSITSKATNIRTVFAGVLRTDDAFNVAVITHEGAVVKVTERMRGMFFQLWLASGARSRATGTATTSAPPPLTGRAAELFSRFRGPWWPLKASTTAIKIPRRPWSDIAFKDPALKAIARENWKEAYKRTFEQIAAAARTG